MIKGHFNKLLVIFCWSIFTLTCITISNSYAEMVDNDDGTVTDTKTGLMWQKVAAGSKPWNEAIEYCETLVLAGHSDWRLPDLNELQSIVDSIRDNPTVFSHTTVYNYWSSTTKDDATDYALSMLLKAGEPYAELGEVYPANKHNGQGVLAVRDGQ